MLFDQISGDMVRNARLAEQAQANSIEQFKQVFEPEVMKAFVQRQGRNQKIVNDFMSDKALRDFIMGALLEEVYNAARI